MGMELTTKQMADILTQVEEIAKLRINVRVITVEGHDVYLKQSAGGLSIVGITNKTKDHQEGSVR